MAGNSFEQMLTGGHPNSLGNTLEVVDIILSEKERLEELYQCYFSEDEVVRLRVSNAFKRICKEHPDWVAEYIERFLTEISKIDQASTQWTLAQLFNDLKSFMDVGQINRAKEHMKKNLTNHDDWIVLNTTMQTLYEWSLGDSNLLEWIKPHLERLSQDKRKSISNRAKKLIKAILKH